MRWTPEMKAWLDANYATGSIAETHEAFRAEFGRAPSTASIATMANKRGLHKRHETHTADRARRAGVIARWSAHPEWVAWMLANDREESCYPIIDAFEREFGHRLTRYQVTRFRGIYGTKKRESRGGGRPARPVGSETSAGDGYIYVKVAEEPSTPQTKDNWRLKHHLVYEEAFGPIPDGHNIVFADGNRGNLDPANLVAVPREVAGVINKTEYHDRETLEAQVAIALLKVKVNDIERLAPRTCGVCGEEFEPEPEARRRSAPLQTCQRCREAGHRAAGVRRYAWT